MAGQVKRCLGRNFVDRDILAIRYTASNGFRDQYEIFAGVFAGEGSFVSKIAAAVLVLVALSVLTVPMSAQLLPNGNAYIGYSYGQLTNVVNSQSYSRGWNASFEDIPFSRRQYLGFVGDASGFYRTSVGMYNFLGGARVATNYGRWRPFAQAMAGVRHQDSSGFISNFLLLDFGGGADYKLSIKNFSWRVQADYMHSHYLSAYQNDFRASTGLVWRF